jgi:hypothetical protein
MQIAPNQFAHVFLFACPARFRPLVMVCNSRHCDLETVDRHEFQMLCHCGWKGTFRGLRALKHWMEPWTGEAPVGRGMKGSCEQYASM